MGENPLGYYRARLSSLSDELDMCRAKANELEAQEGASRQLTSVLRTLDWIQTGVASFLVNADAWHAEREKQRDAEVTRRVIADITDTQGNAVAYVATVAGATPAESDYLFFLQHGDVSLNLTRAQVGQLVHVLALALESDKPRERPAEGDRRDRGIGRRKVRERLRDAPAPLSGSSPREDNSTYEQVQRQKADLEAARQTERARRLSLANPLCACRLYHTQGCARCDFTGVAGKTERA